MENGLGVLLCCTVGASCAGFSRTVLSGCYSVLKPADQVWVSRTACGAATRLPRLWAGCVYFCEPLIKVLRSICQLFFPLHMILICFCFLCLFCCFFWRCHLLYFLRYLGEYDCTNKN